MSAAVEKHGVDRVLKVIEQQQAGTQATKSAKHVLEVSNQQVMKEAIQVSELTASASFELAEERRKLINVLKNRNILVLTLEAAKFDRAMIPFAQKYKVALKAVRHGYASELAEMKDLGARLLSSKVPLKRVAKIMHEKRRIIGKKYKDLTPEELRHFIYRRNIKDSDDPLGPSFRKLIEIGRKRGFTDDKLWNKIIETSTSPNSALNKFVDLL
jgi:hypothetical protein